MTPSRLPHVRAALSHVVGRSLDALPVEDWLDARAGPPCAGPREPGSAPRVDALLSGLAPLDSLLVDLRAIGLPAEPTRWSLLRLAALLDLVQVRASPLPPFLLGLLRAVLREVGSPWSHAACLLDLQGARCLGALGEANASALLRAAARTLATSVPHTDEAFRDGQVAALEEALGQVRMGALLSRMGVPPARQAWEAAVDRARSLGRGALDLGDRLRGAWEIQRSGFADHRYLTGDLFVPLLVLDALEQGGRDVSEHRAEVLKARLGIGIRYYREARRMPFDADDAAEVLLSVRRLPHGEARFAPLVAQAVEVIRAAIKDDGVVRTWVALPGIATRWRVEDGFGPVCSGVAARTLLAMAGSPDLFSDLEVVRTGRWLAQRADPSGVFAAEHYPDPVVSTAMVVGALRVAGQRVVDPVATDACGAALRWMAGRARPDGSLGTGALATATFVHCLLDGGSAVHEVLGVDRDSVRATLADAAVALVHAQREDGAWQREPMFVCPYPGGRMGPFGASALTTALALGALGRISEASAGW